MTDIEVAGSSPRINYSLEWSGSYSRGTISAVEVRANSAILESAVLQPPRHPLVNISPSQGVSLAARIRVGSDHRISGSAPSIVPAGRYEVTIRIAGPPRETKRLRVTDLPADDVPWDGSVSLRREDMYGDDGR
jgi:hypothetical protein